MGGDGGSSLALQALGDGEVREREKGTLTPALSQGEREEGTKSRVVAPGVQRVLWHVFRAGETPTPLDVWSTLRQGAAVLTVCHGHFGRASRSSTAKMAVAHKQELRRPG